MPSLERVGKLVGVAALYALGGVLSYYLADWGDRLFKGRSLYHLSVSAIVLMPLPFALLSAALFLRNRKAVLSVPLNCAAWAAAYAIAIQLAANGGAYFAMAYYRACLAAGFVGGLGVVLADSICHPRLLALKHLGAAALIGAVAGLPFASDDWPAACDFAIWQASMGTYLYFVCTGGGETVATANTPAEGQE